VSKKTRDKALTLFLTEEMDREIARMAAAYGGERGDIVRMCIAFTLRAEREAEQRRPVMFEVDRAPKNASSV
jgi:hypothetical protein